MSFSKAKLKRFNDIDVICGSPAVAKQAEHGSFNTVVTPTSTSTNSSTAGSTSAATSSSSTAHPERKEQIEKFFKDAVRFASNSKEVIRKDGVCGGVVKEDKKSKGLRLFRTPSLPHRLRFRQNSDASTNASSTSTASSTPLHSATTTPVKELTKSANRLKGKEALQQEIRSKNELIDNYLRQIDVLKRHVEQLKDTEQKIRIEQSQASQKTDNIIQELSHENLSLKQVNENLSSENMALNEYKSHLETELEALREKYIAQIDTLNDEASELRSSKSKLEQTVQVQRDINEQLKVAIKELEEEISQAREKLNDDEFKMAQNFEMVQNLKSTNDALIADVKKLKYQMEQDALAYAQETKVINNEIDCLKNERNTLKHDLANKCTLIRSLQEELLDKNCEIDAHCDTIRQMCREKAKYVEREHMMETAEEKVRLVEVQAEQKVQKLESDLENALEREKAFWRSELDKRQKMAENEIIKIELEKQDVMILLETTNDMLRERDEKIQKYEEQIRNGIDYYIQLTDNLQRQVVDLKQDIAKTITEKYNYQLTLNNTRSTVNILMERLKKSDGDVEQLKSELESLQLEKGALEQSYLTMQEDMETLRKQLTESEAALQAVQTSAQNLQQEVSIKETIFNDLLSNEEETLAKFNKIASSFQERIELDATRYAEMYNELKNKDETREMYMQDMKKALDEFATVLQFAQMELDSKEQTLTKVREECEQLKLENITLKSKIEGTPSKNKQNTTDFEKIEDLLIDSELRAECDKITSWLLSSSEKCVRSDNSNELNELLKPSTPNNKNKSRSCTTPVRSGNTGSATKVITPHSPRTPRTPHTPKNTNITPRTTPKKTVLFVGKENIPSPQKQVLKARNV